MVILATDVQCKYPGYPAPASTFPACRIGMENNSISPGMRQREPKVFLRCKVLIASSQTAGLGTGIRSSKTMQASVAVTKYNRSATETSLLKKKGGGILFSCFTESFRFTCKTKTVPPPPSFLLEWKPTLPAALFDPAVKP